jgi:Tat protein translocase TatB subunit
MFDIGMPELIVIIIVALLVFGPKRLPELARAAGKGLAELKKSLHDVKQQVETEVKAIEGEEEGSVGKGLVDLKKSFEDVKRVVQTGFKEALDTSVAQKPVISAYEEIGEEEGDDLFGEEEEKEKKDEQNMKSLV